MNERMIAIRNKHCYTDRIESFYTGEHTMKDERKIVSIRLDDDLHKRFKIYCIQKGTSMQESMVELLRECLEKAEKEYGNDVRK